MSDTFKRPVSVLVVVHTRDGEVLMLSRTSPAGFWQSVTGSLEAGESPLDAAVRELEEETGIRAGPIDRHEFTDFPISDHWRSRYAPDACTNREHVFTLSLDGRPPIVLDPDEHVAYAWLSRDAAIARAFSPTNRAAIERWVPAARATGT